VIFQISLRCGLRLNPLMKRLAILKYRLNLKIEPNMENIASIFLLIRSLEEMKFPLNSGINRGVALLLKREKKLSLMFPG